MVLTDVYQIAKAMNLQCNSGCNHKFCLTSFLDGTYKKGEFVGSGEFGKVHKYRRSNTNRDIAVKETKSDYEKKNYIEGNLNKFASQIQHRNIVRYFGALEKSGKLYIFMEFISGGTLKLLIDKSKSIEHGKVIKFSKQILEGLQFLHSKGIIHRDIKPENMLIDHDGTLKLADFGLGKLLRPVPISEHIEKVKTFCGTPNYLAPEFFLDEPYSLSVDIWSCGASVIHMITGKMPYHLLKPYEVMLKIATEKKIEFTPCKPISKTLQSFINDLLTPEQSKRPSAESLLKHSIFKDVK